MSLVATTGKTSFIFARLVAFREIGFKSNDYASRSIVKSSISQAPFFLKCAKSTANTIIQYKVQITIGNILYAVVSELSSRTLVTISHKAILRIMRKYDLLALAKRKHFQRYKLDTYHHYDDLLNRSLSASMPNKKWATDISYIPTDEGFLYLSVIKDL